MPRKPFHGVLLSCWSPPCALRRADRNAFPTVQAFARPCRCRARQALSPPLPLDLRWPKVSERVQRCRRGATELEASAEMFVPRPRARGPIVYPDADAAQALETVCISWAACSSDLPREEITPSDPAHRLLPAGAPPSPGRARLGLGRARRAARGRQQLGRPAPAPTGTADAEESAGPPTVISHFPSRAHAEELVPTLAMIVVVRRSGHRKKFTEPVALSSTQPADLPLPRRASRLSFDLLALRARCVEEAMGKARLGQAPANLIAAVCALLRAKKICVERVPGISGIAVRVWICARSCGPLAAGSDPHPHHPPARNDIGP